MEEGIFAKIISENGIIAGLFVMIVVSFLWKGIPAVYRKFEQMEARHREELEKIAERHRQELKELHEEFSKNLGEQVKTFERTMDRVVVTFNTQINKSDLWHEKHSKDISELKSIITKDTK